MLVRGLNTLRICRAFDLTNIGRFYFARAGSDGKGVPQHLASLKNCVRSRLLILAQLLKSRIAAQCVPPGIEAEQRWSEGSQVSRRKRDHAL